MLSALRYQIDNKDLTPNVKIKNKAKQVVYNLIPVLGRQGQGNLGEFEASLV